MAKVKPSRVLDAIRQIGLCANSKPQAEQALHCAVEHAREMLDCQTIAIILANTETGGSGIKISRGLTNRFLTGYRHKPASGPISSDVWWGKPLLVNQADSDSSEYKAQKLEHDFSSAVTAPIAVDGRLIGYVFCDSDRPGHFDEDDLRLVEILAQLAGWAVEKERLTMLTKALTRTTELGMTLTFDAFYEELEQETAVAKRYNSDLSLMLLRINNFHEWRNTHGPRAAAEFYAEVAELVQQSSRTPEIIGRHEVSDIVVCLSHTGPEGSACLGRRICDEVARHVFKFPEPETTVSIGVTALSKENDTVASMLHAVKAATFQAQRLGKNAVAIL